MNNLPIFITIFLVLTTLLTVGIFFRAARYSKTTLFVLVIWLLVQSAIALSGFYLVTDTIPPRFSLTIVPPFVFIISLFFTVKGRRYLDSLDLKTLTVLHSIRIPVELMLFFLFINKTIPGLMTFEGRNLDILSGITAPVIFYFGFIKQKLNKTALLVWNLICLGLLINIVALAILSAPFPFQQYGFDQPNIAILYFPFIWLPCCIVPLVLLSHLAAIRQIVMSYKKSGTTKSLPKVQMAETI